MTAKQNYSPDSPIPSGSSTKPLGDHRSFWITLPRIKHKIIIALLIISCFSTIFLLSGCGPEEQSSSDSDQLFADAERIADAYVASNNLNSARVALSSMSVANANQWLVYVTETSITQRSDATITASLVRLSLDLGLTSVLIDTHAVKIGLLQPTSVVDIAANTQQSDSIPPIQPAPEVVIPASPIKDDSESSENADGTSTNRATEVASELVDSESTNAAESVNSEAGTIEDEPNAAEPPSVPLVTATSGLNVRSGPGTEYTLAGSLEGGESALVIGRNAQGDWWQIQLNNGQEGWVFGQLVSTTGSVDTVAVATNIPAPPPTAAPVPTDVPIEAPTAPLVEEQSAPVPPTSGNQFVLIERRLWGAEENGGRWNGPSLVCGEKRELHVYVLDSGGAPMNGVAVQEQYGAKDILVTGSQGKGDGKVEIVLGGGQDVKVVRDNQGNDVTSDLASGMVTVPGNIAFGDLIAAGYCTDDASCQETIVKPYACGGHWSWTVKFKKNY